MAIIRLLRQQRRDNYKFLRTAPMLPDAGGFPRGLITSSFIDLSVDDTRPLPRVHTGETCFPPRWKVIGLVPRAPDDETPVDFPDETSLSGESGQPGGLVGTPRITTRTSAADKLMLRDMPVALSTMEQLTRLRQLYTYKYPLTRIKHARAYRSARCSNKDFLPSDEFSTGGCRELCSGITKSYKFLPTAQ